jgi:DNA-binding response OmpR family regulator
MNQPRVLLADDDQSVLEALGAVLESEGFEVIRAADGHQAVKMFYERPADLVLLDLNMPVKGGWDTLERLKTINPFLPVIVITARPNAPATAQAAGAAGFMQKPLNIRVLLDAMWELLAQPAHQCLARLITLQPQTDSNP